MKTKSFEQVLKESSPAVKRAYKKELKKVSKKKVTRQDRVMTIKDLGMIKVGGNKCSICKEPFGNFDAIGIYDGKDCHSDCYPVKPPVFKVTKTTGLPNEGFKKTYKDVGIEPNRFADKDFSRFAPEDTYTATENYKKHTNFLGEIEGEPTINCDKWTAMCVVLVLLCLVAYAMHGDYQAVQSNLIH